MRDCCCSGYVFAAAMHWLVDEDVRCGNLIATMLLSLVALVLLLWLQSCESQANGQQQLCIGSVVACCALWQVASGGLAGESAVVIIIWHKNLILIMLTCWLKHISYDRSRCQQHSAFVAILISFFLQLLLFCYFCNYFCYILYHTICCCCC